VQQSLIIFVLHVRNNFIKSGWAWRQSHARDRISALFKGQTSKEYYNTGMHLLFSRCKKTSSKASLPILLNKAFYMSS